MRAFLHATLYLKSVNIAMSKKSKQNVDTIGRSALNVSQDNVWKFLVHVLVTAPNQQLQGSFQSEDTREQWENAFSAHIINAQRNLNAMLENCDAAFRQDCRNEFNSLPTVLYGIAITELPNPQSFKDDLMCFEKFWARTPKVALATFAAQINADKYRYPLLSALLDEDVEALQRIPTFLLVFKEIVKHYNVDESHNIHTIKDFLDDLPVAVSESVSDGVRSYIRTWNTLIRHRLDMYTTIKCLFKDRLTMDAPLKFFLPTRHVNDCAVLVTMNFLISKNNELIEKYRGACKIEIPVLYLEEGNVGEDNVVWVSDLKKDLLSVVVTFTTKDFTNNTPTVIHDFAAIERAVGSRLCAFKPLIRMKIMPLMSKSSSTKSALNNARPHLEEKPLGKNEAGRVKKAFTDIPEVCKALRQLVLLMKYLDKDCSRESSTIAEYMTNKLKLECVPAIGNYELNQTVSLWQHLSVRKTYLMMGHGGENPYPEILEEFKEELDFDKREHLSKMKKEKLLIMLDEFIVLNLHQPELMKPDYHIEEDCLNIYFVEETELGLPEWAELRYAEDIIKLLIQTGLANNSYNQKKYSGCTFTKQLHNFPFFLFRACVETTNVA